VPAAGPLASFNRLQEIVARLRAPDGCPWDREQTVQSLRKDLLEEVYELIEALDQDDDAKIGEELGDAVLGLTMIAQIAAEEERFRWPQVMAAVNEKLIRRHPHVFGDEQVTGVADVLENWVRIKEEERGGDDESPPSPLAGVPKALPALMRASKYQSRLARAGIEPDLGDASPIARALWDLVGQARAAQVDAEAALRAACELVEQTVNARQP
jgi:tetrapyrrole methylase family protein/MazG family protein